MDTAKYKREMSYLKQHSLCRCHGNAVYTVIMGVKKKNRALISFNFREKKKQMYPRKQDPCQKTAQHVTTSSPAACLYRLSDR